MTYTKPAAIVACAFSLAVATVIAPAPVHAQEMDAGDIAADTLAGTSAEVIVPLIILALLTLALSSGGGGGAERVNGGHGLPQ